ncbi:hypothetical protein [Burkholderia thailandensis]|uniref:hypothetical protein n=1 Tax=Burkholderia thailandensis TaxID=57975 RepID=UPI0021B49515|nr:hypothetical protein [Burkholderia thailandensis]
MQELAKRDEPVTRRVVSRDEAVSYFRSIGEKYKAEIIESIPASDEIKLYSHGASPICAAARTCRRRAS